MLETAIALADQHGLEAFSMRKLADELGVAAMSLYHHVPNKDQWLDAMIDVVFSEIELPSTDDDWQTAMRKRAVSTLEALNRHRWAVGLMEGRSTHGPANLRLHNAVLGCLRGAGFSLEMTVHAYSVQDAYIYGFALQQADMTPETSDDFAATAEQQMETYKDVLADYPHLVEVVGGHVATAGYDYETEFLFGLDLILAGLDSCCERTQPPARQQAAWLAQPSWRCEPRPAAIRSASRTSFTRGRPCGSPAERSCSSIACQPSQVTASGAAEESHSAVSSASGRSPSQAAGLAVLDDLGHGVGGVLLVRADHAARPALDPADRVLAAARRPSSSHTRPPSLRIRARRSSNGMSSIGRPR